MARTRGNEMLRRLLSAPTGAQIARAVGVSRTTVLDWASGKTVPSPKYREALRAATGIEEVEWLTDAERQMLADIAARERA